MRMRFIGIGVTASLLTGVVIGMTARQQPALPATADDDDDKGTVIALADAPAPVRAAIGKVGREADVRQVTRENDDGATTYEVAFNAGGKTSEAEITEAGDVIEIASHVDAGSLPAAAAAAIRKAFPNAAIKEAESVQVFLYEVVLAADGKEREVTVTAAGQMDDDDDGNGDDDDDDDGDDDDGDDDD